MAKTTKKTIAEKGSLKDILLNAAPKNICNPGLLFLQANQEPKALLDFYKEHIDYCFDNNFPSAEMLNEHAGAILMENGFFVDKHTHLINTPFVISLNKSNLSIFIANYNVSQVFAKNESKIDLIADENAFVVMDLFDNVEAVAEAKGSAKIIVNLYGNAKVKATGNVNVIMKNKNTY